MVLSVGLTLAETLVKNCHDPVHREIASERFMAAVAKIARVSELLSCCLCNARSEDHNRAIPVRVCVCVYVGPRLPRWIICCGS